MDLKDRDTPWPRDCAFSSGFAYSTVLSRDGALVSRPGVGQLADSKVGSLVIERSRQPVQSETDHLLALHLIQQYYSDDESRNPEEEEEKDGVAGEEAHSLQLPGGERETVRFVPAEQLHGLLPQALLEQYTFWRTGRYCLRGYLHTAQGSDSSGGRNANATSILVSLQGRVRFANPRSSGGFLDVELPHPRGKPCRSYSCADVQALARAQYPLLSEADVSHNAEGVPLPRDASLNAEDAGIVTWSAVVRRLPYYDSSTHSKRSKRLLEGDLTAALSFVGEVDTLMNVQDAPKGSAARQVRCPALPLYRSNQI